jgi:hypothetical protein
VKNTNMPNLNNLLNAEREKRYEILSKKRVSNKPNGKLL